MFENHAHCGGAQRDDDGKQTIETSITVVFAVSARLHLEYFMFSFDYWG